MTPSPLVESVRAFIDALPAEKGYSAHTCRAYARDLEEFIRYLADSGAAAEGNGRDGRTPAAQGVTAVSIRGYLGWRLSSTVTARLAVERRFAYAPGGDEATTTGTLQVELIFPSLWRR